MKHLCVISCPIDTYSGYGSRSRDFVKALIEAKGEEWDIKILPQRWGETNWNFIEDNKDKWGFLSQHIWNIPNLPKQPEVWIQITVPNEFQPVGKFNIGVTAGIETTIAAAEWIEGMNRMDLNLVSSNHAKDVFMNSKFEKRNPQTQAHEGNIFITKPIEVLFEGADINTYLSHQTNGEGVETDFSLSTVPESFCYLYAGMWLPGPISEDRKNTGLLIKAFYETFKNKKKKPALILKTSQIGASYVDREEILKKIAQIKKTINSTDLPNIYLLHGEFTDEEMNNLYNHPKIKAMVNLTKGEGFGRPLLEFSLTKKPIIVSGWSGHTDFLDKEFTVLLPGQLTNVHPQVANGLLLKESQWFSVDTGHVGHYLTDVFENYKNYLEGAKRQAFKSKSQFSFDKMKEVIIFNLNKYVPEFPKQVQLQLPKLKKIELPKLKTIEA